MFLAEHRLNIDPTWSPKAQHGPTEVQPGPDMTQNVVFIVGLDTKPKNTVLLAQHGLTMAPTWPGLEQSRIKSKEHSKAKNQATLAQRQVISSIVHSKHGVSDSFLVCFFSFLLFLLSQAWYYKYLYTFH